MNDDPLVNTDMHHLRKRWDYFVSPLLLMQSWNGWLAYRECFILFGGSQLHEFMKSSLALQAAQAQDERK